MEAAREQKAETLQDRIEVNKLDIVLPGSELHAAAKKQESKGLESAAGKAQRWQRPEAGPVAICAFTSLPNFFGMPSLSKPHAETSPALLRSVE